MFQIGEYVMTAQDGLCQIKNVVKKDFLGTEKEYYELTPIVNGKTTSYVPVQNDGRMRLPISKEEATDIVEKFATIEPEVIKVDKLRGDLFKEITKEGNVERCISLWKYFYLKKTERIAENKMLPSLDDRYFRHVCSYLYNEMAFAMGCEASDIEKMLIDKMK